MSEEKSSFSDVDLTKAPEPTEEQPEKEESQNQEEHQEEEVKTVDQALASFPGSPSEGDLEKWKQEHGEVLCSGFSDTELFVFRPLRRDEFVNLQAYVQQQQGQLTQYDVEAKIVDTCVLWASPRGVQSLERKAGSLSTLHEQILQVSNFMNPAMASSYVVRL